MADAETLTLHATCVLVGESGILIRGRSGAGKSSLALRLIGHVMGAGGFAALVSDDRVRLGVHNQRLVARSIPAIAGRCEVRGLGLMPMAYEPSARLNLVVDIMDTSPERFPDEMSRHTQLLGLKIGLLRLAVGDVSHQNVILALAALQNAYDLT
jgi:HPr kinase/phosphorylase